jgi:signal transduction histidine kinase
LIETTIELARLVPPEELDELIDSIRRALGCHVAVFSLQGHRLAGADAAGEARIPFIYEGEQIGHLAASGPNAEAAAALTCDALALVVHHAQARALGASTAEAAMQLSYAELTEHNNRLQKAVARLEELDRLKSNFLATMSHELRTPLTSVIGYAEMMSEGLAGPVTPEQREYLQTILGKADQLLGLITSVLEVSSLESAPAEMERASLSLADLVANEAATYAAQAGKRGIAIHVDVHGDSYVVGDRKKLRQVVSSLLSNAIKFTPDRGQVKVELRLGALALGELDSTRAVQLIVADSGIGISRDQVAKIFEPFFQVDSSSTRAFGGTGLGLTLAKAYVEAHGGRIWVDTAPGQGSIFTATFPHIQRVEVTRRMEIVSDLP